MAPESPLRKVQFPNLNIRFSIVAPVGHAAKARNSAVGHIDERGRSRGCKIPCHI
jgi:hypothetical protein